MAYRTSRLRTPPGPAAGLALALILGACMAAAPVASPSPGLSPVAPAHWTYEGDTGPENWGSLDPAFAACASGREQSPVDIADAAQADLANIDFAYRPAPLRITNTGHTVQVNYEPGSRITLDERQYELLQFHLHAPSEHLVNGDQADAELHLVHRADDGRLAVVGIMLTVGGVNPALVPVFEHLPSEVGTERAPAAQVDAAAILPGSRTTFRYDGSLTTPPCTEAVSWLLMTESIQVGADQLAAFTALIEDNNRPVQPLNDRQIEEDVTP